MPSEEFTLATDRPGRRNPVGNGFSLKQTVFQREREAARNEDPASHRMWALFNPNRLSSLGHPAAYVLESGMNTVPFLSPKSPARRAAGFINHHLWVTRHRDAERHPAGEYSANPGKTDTLPAWVSNNEPIYNQDVVVWYTLGSKDIRMVYQVWHSVQTGAPWLKEATITSSGCGML